MVNQRSLATLILLSIVTLGIYDIYFWYKYSEDMNMVCAGDGDETPSFIVAWLLGIVTCGIYLYYWYYKVGNRLQANGPRYGLYFQENGTTILMWSLFGALLCGIGVFYAWHLMIKNMNAIGDAFNRNIQNAGQQAPPQYPPAGTYPPQQ